MVTFTASPMQITHTRAPKPGGHSQYGFWPLDPEGLLHGLLAITLSPAAVCTEALCGCDPRSCDGVLATDGCADLCVLASSCGDRHSHCSPFPGRTLLCSPSYILPLQAAVRQGEGVVASGKGKP